MNKRYIAAALILLLTIGVLYWARNRGSTTPEATIIRSMRSKALSATASLKATVNQMPPEIARFFTSDYGKAAYRHDFRRMAAKLNGVTLTKEQAMDLQDIYSAIYEARLNYEISKASVSKVSEDQNLIQIPSYSAFGTQLKHLLGGMFVDELGLPVANQVFDQLGTQIAAENNQWGQFPQSIAVGVDSDGQYVVAHTINPDPASTGSTYQLVLNSTLDPSRLGPYAPFKSLFPNSSQSAHEN
jgi:hypothetical protein